MTHDKGTPTVEPIATLHELFPYVLNEIGPAYYKVLRERYIAQGDRESIEIKVARQLKAIPINERRDENRELRGGLLDLTSLGLTPEEAALIRNQPREMDSVMTIYKGSGPNSRQPNGEGHTPHNVYPKPSWRTHLHNKWEELKPAGFAASFKEAEERLRELEAGDDGAALEPTRSSPTGLRDRASAATGQFVVDPGDDEGSISVASMGRGVRR